MRPVKDLKEFLNEYGIKGHFTEKEEMINAIKGSLNERYFQQRAKQRNLDSKARRKSQPNNPMMGVFNTFFGGKGESSKSRSKNDFMANLGAFAQEIQQEVKGVFSNFADDNSNQTESAAGTSGTSFERERRPYTASTQTNPAAENINRTSNSKLNQNQESIPTTKTANEPTANHNSLPENNNDGFEGVFTIDEDIPINSQNRADSSSRDNRDKRPIVPDIIISNDPDLDQPHSPPIEIPIREHRPYSYSSSAPAEMMETVNLMSIMAQNIPLESLSTKTLRLILLQERVSTAHILEKQDLIAKVQTLIKNIRGEIANQNNDEMLCRICVDNVINCVLLECGHYTLCLECAETIKRSTKECPICRQTITRIVHTFKS